LNNLAWMLKEQKRYGDAEAMMRRALSIRERHFGPDHPHVATSLNNLALLLMDTGRLEDAEPLMRRALAIDEASFGGTHQHVASRLDSLAAMQAERGNWAEAAALGRRASAILVVRGTEPRAQGTGFAKAELASSTWSLRAHARAVFRADPAGAAAREIGFELAQWALQNGAADALSQMSARFAKGAGPLATLVRERQDILGRRQGEDRRLLAALGRADAPGSVASRQAIAALDAKLRAIDVDLRSRFKEYADLADPRPLTIGAVQSLLSANEALVFFLDLPQFGRLPEETLVFALTKTGAHWHSTPLGTGALSKRITALRCGLDRDGEWVWSPTVRRWLARKALCQGLWPSGLRADEPLPFDFARAQELHAALLGPIADLIAGKRLLIVPSGPLTTLPFHVLVSKAPDGSHAGMERYRGAAWLGVSHAISVLPSVGSLQAVRKLARSQAPEPYIGFGNPLFEGRPGDERHARRAAEARDKQRCPIEVAAVRQQVAQAAPAAPVLASLIRGGSVDLAAARQQLPLPETRDELCAVAKSLGALGKESETVWLGARASEANLKRLDKEGKLARYRIVHFATHGLLAGETEAFSKGKAEPALMLTPPADGRSAAELNLDDGFLMASEVAQLKLDADWVVLSACNTAAGGSGDAEALSGLARAFFYAKARALLVSHWYVDSASTVALISGAFAELRASERPGRAEALRRAMRQLIGSPAPLAAHPASWAPFVLVGEGGQ
jgi:CHAT domain-containing protein/tetratricopeptide (TPR) repeat protein